MSKTRKVSALEIFMVACCSIGLTLMFLPKFIATEMNLTEIGFAFNGIGIFALLKVMSNKSKTHNE